MRKHGGAISVESEPGEGAEMIITLPFEPPERLADEDEWADEDAAPEEAADADGEA